MSLLRPLLLAVAGSLLVPAIAFANEGDADQPPDAEQPSRPDIVVVMVDDLGAIDERVLKRLPNIRSLWLDGGLRFDQYFAETPLCCPGRATFLSGQHSRRHGVTTNNATRIAAFDQSRTIATALQAAGYHTIFSGKHFNSMSRFDVLPPGWDRAALLHSWTDQESSYYVQGELVSQAGYRDRFSGQKALGWLAEAPTDRPLFMWLAPHAPHKYLPTDPAWKPSVEARYATDQRCAGIAPWKPPSYRLRSKPNGFPLTRICRSLLTVDDIVGKLRAEADAQDREPIWVFTSDNGMAWGSHGYALKRVPWADRVPLYIAGPGTRGGATSALHSTIDLSPTLAELAGTSLPWADGQSFAELLVAERSGRSWMLEDYPAYPKDSGKVSAWWSVRQPSWRLIRQDKADLLFNLSVDPWQLKNVAAKRPAKVRELRSLYKQALASLSAATVAASTAGHPSGNHAIAAGPGGE